MTASSEVISDLLNRFRYHKPDQQAMDRHGYARSDFHRLAIEIVEMTSSSREQSLALTNLEQAMFWTNAAIARMDTDGKRL